MRRKSKLNAKMKMKKKKTTRNKEEGIDGKKKKPEKKNEILAFIKSYNFFLLCHLYSFIFPCLFFYFPYCALFYFVSSIILIETFHCSVLTRLCCPL